MALWGGRFAQGSSNMFRQVNDSIGFDQVMAAQDIWGSIIWSRAIAKAGVLTTDEQDQIETALDALLAKAKAGELDFSQTDEEDIHAFVEAELTKQLGDIGRKLHTGRSRNDQVATDFRLWVKDHVSMLRRDLIAVITALTSVAQRTEDVIFPGYTHLQRDHPVRFAH